MAENGADGGRKTTIAVERARGVCKGLSQTGPSTSRFQPRAFRTPSVCKQGSNCTVLLLRKHYTFHTDDNVSEIRAPSCRVVGRARHPICPRLGTQVGGRRPPAASVRRGGEGRIRTGRARRTHPTELSRFNPPKTPREQTATLWRHTPGPGASARVARLSHHPTTSHGGGPGKSLQ